MHRILNQTVLLRATDAEYRLKVRIKSIIPSLNGRHFAASPAGLVSIHDKASISISRLRESYGVTEEDAALACVDSVAQFLSQKKTRELSRG